MGEPIKVKFVGPNSFLASIVARDCTVGKIYSASRLHAGSLDAYGNRVACDCHDAITITDDVGDVVETKLSSGFEIVEDVQ